MKWLTRNTFLKTAVLTSRRNFSKNYVQREHVPVKRSRYEPEPNQRPCLLSIPSRKMSKFAGFRVKEMLVAPFTPMFENGDINLSVCDKFVDYMINTNVTGLFVNGSLAEGLSLTQEERKKLAEAWVTSSNGRLETIIHVGSNCIRDSQELARHAEQCGATGIAAISPFYYRPENEDMLVEIISQVAGAAPNTPFYYYEINFCTGIYHINVRRFLELAKQRIPTFRGMKYTSKELPQGHECAKIDDLQVLMGTDLQYLSCLALGIPGVISAPYMGNLLTDMRRAFDAGDMVTARKYHDKIRNIDRIISKYGGGMNVTKYLFSILVPEIDVGPVRLPLRHMTSSQVADMKKDIVETGLIDIARPQNRTV